MTWWGSWPQWAWLDKGNFALPKGKCLTFLYKCTQTFGCCWGGFYLNIYMRFLLKCIKTCPSLQMQRMGPKIFWWPELLKFKNRYLYCQKNLYFMFEHLYLWCSFWWMKIFSNTCVIHIVLMFEDVVRYIPKIVTNCITHKIQSLWWNKELLMSAL